MTITPFICHRCGNETYRLISNPRVPEIDCVCRACADELSHSGSFSRAPAFALPAHPSERAVVWKHPRTGEGRYPPQNNVDLPQRYKEQGFERHELPTLRDLERHEREHKVRSEAAWMDRGSGRGLEED